MNEKKYLLKELLGLNGWSTLTSFGVLSNWYNMSVSDQEEVEEIFPKVYKKIIQMDQKDDKLIYKLSDDYLEPILEKENK